MSLARVFQLDALIGSSDQNVRKIGVSMGAVIMSRVADIELEQIVEKESSMQRISHGVLKYVVSSQRKMLLYCADQLDDVHERFTQFEESTDALISNFQSKISKVVENC